MADCPSYLGSATPRDACRRRARVLPFKFSDGEFQKDRRHVFLRLKPKNKKQQSVPFVVLDDSTLVPHLKESQKARKGFSHQYKFTKIFGSHSNQEEVFKETCHTPLSNFINGTNCLVFAYGATNAGKTFTIQGSQEKPGIIPRSLNLLFNSIKDKISKEIKFKPDKINNVLWLTSENVEKELETKQSILNFNFDRTLNKPSRGVSALSTFSEEGHLCYSSSSDSSGVCPIFQTMKTHLDDEAIDLEEDPSSVYSVWVSYAEIYNENIYDLLQPATKQPRKPLVMGENDKKEVYIKGLTDVCVWSAEEAFKVFMYGKHNLHQAPTSINHVSSRSHSIFSIKLVKYLNIDCPTFAQLSMCTFVDLAGTERAKKTLNAGERMKESQCINTSLHVLGKCLEVLRYKQKSRDPVTRLLPCRESKLTRLFQRALEGKEVLTMIVNINQDEKLCDETMNVLKFSAVAMELQFDRFDNSTVCSLRKSSFSTYMGKLSSSLQSSIGNIEEVPEDDRYMKLLVYTEELKRSLEEEKMKCQTVEVQVRKEAYAHFRKIMSDMQETHRERLKAERNMYAEYEEVNANLYQKYIQERCKRNREEDSESDDDDDDNDDDDDDDDEDRVDKEDYEEKIKFLENKVEILNGLVGSSEQMKMAHIALQTEHTKLQFQLATVKQELQHALKVNESINVDGDNDLVIKELQSYLREKQTLIEEQNTEVEELKKLLEDAKTEYDEHFQEHEDFASRNAELEKVIAEQDIKIEDLQTQFGICNKKLAQHQQHLNEKELEDSDVLNKLQLACEARDELKFEVINLGTEIKKLKKEKEENRNQQKSLDSSELRSLEALVASHEDQLKKSKETQTAQEEIIKALQEEIDVLNSSSVCSAQVSYEKEISILQIEIKETAKVKKDLNDKIEAISKELDLSKEALRLADAALTEEQNNTKAIRKICESEKDKLIEEVQTAQDALMKLQEECEVLLREKNDLKLQNLELEEAIKMKEEELEGFKTRRDAQFETYESMLRHERELREREQREVHQIQNVLRTLTPQKNEQLAHITKLKDELKDAYMTISELKKEKISGLSQTTEVAQKPRTRRIRKTHDENLSQNVSEDEIGPICLPDIPIKPDPEADGSRQLRPRRKKILYTNDNQEDMVLRPKSSRRRHVP